MVKQYEIYWVNLDSTKGSEINKKRPCVVISPEEMNKNLHTVIVAPLTSTIKPYPTRVAIFIDKQKGQIALDQIQTIDKIRLSNKIGVLTNETIAKTKSILVEMFK
jgi:mRNA interferase MazF